MHIPDGYLGPPTYLAAWGVMAPLWARASSRLRRSLAVRELPMMALAAAFAFLVMMVNVPLPGGTSGHAVGSVLVAVLLGPWAALVAVSLALAVQALLFGDGGITTLAANCLTMAAVMPFTGWWTYRLLVGRAGAGTRRAALAAGFAAYVAVNLAALAAGVLLGIQPALAADAAGRPLYCPFPLAIAVPAMAIPHLLVIGFVEAVVTALVLSFLARTDPGLAARGSTAAPDAAGRRTVRRLAIAAAVVLALAPAALVLTARLGGGTAWGEWSARELDAVAGYLPSGLARASGLWRPPLPDYGPGPAAASGDGARAGWYLAAAVLGVAAIAGATLALRRALAGRDRRDSA